MTMVRGEIIMASERRRRWSREEKEQLVAASFEPGMTVSEIADSTKWSASKVKVRAHRARASLRKVLARFL